MAHELVLLLQLRLCVTPVNAVLPVLKLFQEKKEKKKKKKI
jgi:hypothetical protein